MPDSDCVIAAIGICIILYLIYMILTSSYNPLISKSNYKWNMSTAVCYKDGPGFVTMDTGIKVLLKDFPTISFESFMSFYSLNPSSWQLMEYRVRKNKDNKLSYVFSYQEWKKYNKWRKRIEAKKKKQEQIKSNIKSNLEELQRKKITLERQEEISALLAQEIQKDIERISEKCQPVKSISQNSSLQIKDELEKDICLTLYPSKSNAIH